MFRVRNAKVESSILLGSTKFTKQHQTLRSPPCAGFFVGGAERGENCRWPRKVLTAQDVKRPASVDHYSSVWTLCATAIDRGCIGWRNLYSWPQPPPTSSIKHWIQYRKMQSEAWAARLPESWCTRSAYKHFCTANARTLHNCDVSAIIPAAAIQDRALIW